MIKDYDRQWLLEDGFSHDDILGLEDLVIKITEKFPKLGECSAYAAAYKRIVAVKKQKVQMEIKKSKEEAKFKQMQKDGFGKNYQDGVWAPFNGKYYHDKAKMMADAKALGLEEMGSDEDIAAHQKKIQQRKLEEKNKAIIERKLAIRQSLAQTLKTH